MVHHETQLMQIEDVEMAPVVVTIAKSDMCDALGKRMSDCTKTSEAPRRHAGRTMPSRATIIVAASCITGTSFLVMVLCHWDAGQLLNYV